MTDLTTFTTVHRIPDGLALRDEPVDCSGLHRHTIIHAATGMPVTHAVMHRCAAHLEQALEIVGAYTDVDWTLTAPQDVYLPHCMATRDKLLELPLCYDPETGRYTRCLGDLPTPLTILENR